MDEKLCSRCNEIKSLNHFNAIQKYSKKRGEYTYYFPYCKICNSKNAIESYNSNREENLEYRKLHYHLNKEHYREKQREADQRNREQRREYMRQWQDENPEKLQEYTLYRELHKKHEISLNEWENCKNYFNYRCAYCNLKIEEHLVMYKGKLILADFQKEHVINDGKNDLSNCIPVCKSCNVSKNKIPFFEWYSSTNENFEQDRFDKILNWLNEDYKLYIEK